MEACDGAVRVPNMLPNLDTCESACDIPSLSADIRQCGQDFVDNPETCDEFQFSTCILREPHPACFGLCETQLNCGTTDDVVDCTLNCINAPEAEDPVERRRRRIMFNCSDASVTCEEYEACTGQRNELVNEDDVAALCQADNMCGFFGEDCPERAHALLRASDGNALACVFDRLMNACEDGFLAVCHRGFPMRQRAMSSVQWPRCVESSPNLLS